MPENREILSEELQMKLEHLKQYIANLGSLAVGFSGGVDSSLLTAVAHEVLGDRLIAVTGADASVPEREVNEAAAFCKERGIRHIICRVDPLKEEGYRRNSRDRCYFCTRNGAGSSVFLSGWALLLFSTCLETLNGLMQSLRDGSASGISGCSEASCLQ